MENKNIVAGAFIETVYFVFKRVNFKASKNIVHLTSFYAFTQCMGNPKTFYSTGADASEDTIYELAIAMFLTGAWKVAFSGPKLTSFSFASTFE